MSTHTEPPPPGRVTLTGRTRRAASCRIKPVYANGRKPTTGRDIQYSLSRPAWWNLVGWIWRIKHTLKLLKEDRQWMKSREKSE